LRFLVLSALAASCCGGAQANVYGFVDGDRVSVIISDTPPADGRYVLFKKDGPGQGFEQTDAMPTTQSAGLKLARSRYGSQILAAARETRVDPALLHAVITVESGYNPSARSRAGAVGLMQLMPETAKRYGVKNRLDPAQNIRGGARYLRDLKVLFDNNLQLMLAAYNAGEDAVMKHGRRIPPYRETVTYVPKVMHHYRKIRALADL
jgi:soluble lytic murein transglycosylase-like protein